MSSVRRGFTLVELGVIVMIVAMIAAVLVIAGARQRNAEGAEQSMLNVRTLVAAAHMYYADNAGRPPMRGCGYSQGQITGGWDTWNFGGKDCDNCWVTAYAGLFDEPAFTRPLNIYLHPTRLARPSGYLNTGSGSTWHFIHGQPPQSERDLLQIPVFHSPGDTRSFWRHWPQVTNTISGYDDIGTSYVLNMKWWDDPALASLNFSDRYAEGVRRVGLAFGGANPNYVWVCDQLGDVVPYLSAATQLRGEFGKANYSVLGWVDGRAGYTPMVSNSAVGPWYTLYP